MRIQGSCNLEEGFHSHACTLISDFQLPEPWAINVSSLQATQSMAFCYSSLNGLRQSTFQLRIDKGEHDHPVSLEQSAFSTLGLIRDPQAL